MMFIESKDTYMLTCVLKYDILWNISKWWSPTSMNIVAYSNGPDINVHGNAH